MSSGYQPPTPKQLATEEWILDRGRGRRHCPEHPKQEMIPLSAGLDMCPLPHGSDDTGDQGC